MKIPEWYDEDVVSTLSHGETTVRVIQSDCDDRYRIMLELPSRKVYLHQRKDGGFYERPITGWGLLVASDKTDGLYRGREEAKRFAMSYLGLPAIWSEKKAPCAGLTPPAPAWIEQGTKSTLTFGQIEVEITYSAADTHMILLKRRDLNLLEYLHVGDRFYERPVVSWDRLPEHEKAQGRFLHRDEAKRIALKYLRGPEPSMKAEKAPSEVDAPAWIDERETSTLFISGMVVSVSLGRGAEYLVEIGRDWGTYFLHQGPNGFYECEVSQTCSLSAQQRAERYFSSRDEAKRAVEAYLKIGKSEKESKMKDAILDLPSMKEADFISTWLAFNRRMWWVEQASKKWTLVGFHDEWSVTFSDDGSGCKVWTSGFSADSFDTLGEAKASLEADVKRLGFTVGDPPRPSEIKTFEGELRRRRLNHALIWRGLSLRDLATLQIKARIVVHATYVEVEEGGKMRGYATVAQARAALLEWAEEQRFYVLEWAEE